MTLSSSESDVEHKVIIPLLQALGYRDGDWKTQVTIGKVKLDFLVQSHHSTLHALPYLVIEAKSPRKALSRNLWQLKSYLRETGAALGLLTNGYQFYLLHHSDRAISAIVELKQSTSSRRKTATSSGSPYNKMLVKQLQKLAEDRQLEGFSKKLRKAELIDLLTKADQQASS